MPLVSRAFTPTRVKPPDDRRAASVREKACLEQYDECVLECPGEPDDELVTDAEQECLELCYWEYEDCLLAPDDSWGPACEPDASYCELADSSSDDSASDWTCDSSDSDDYSYDDSSSDWSCDTTDDSSDDYSDDGGWDCGGSDNYDEGDSGDDSDWGEDWGERSPAGGDGIDSPLDLPN